MHYERAPRGYGNTRRIRDMTTVLLERSSLLKQEQALLGISKAGDVIGTNGNVYYGRIERAFWLTGHGDLLRQERGAVYKRSPSWSSIECLSGSMRCRRLRVT